MERPPDSFDPGGKGARTEIFLPRHLTLSDRWIMLTRERVYGIKE